MPSQSGSQKISSRMPFRVASKVSMWQVTLRNVFRAPPPPPP
ncbi:hypothetical protein SAMN05216258_1321, partial [Albimonas pacifica]